MRISRNSKKTTAASHLVVLLTLWAGILVASDLCPALANCQSTGTKLSQTVATPQPAFRYVIVNQSLVHNGRVVIVLFDIKHFTEVNLRELFRLMSKRFSQPDELRVGVFTALDQLPTPEEEDYERLFSTNDLAYVKQIEKYPNATYTRTKNSEEFQYSLGEGRPRQQVIIK